MNNRDYSSTPPRKYPVAAADTLRTSHDGNYYIVP